jgi:hypothetical protein
MSNTLSPELHKQIEQEADVITARMNDRNDYDAGKIKGFEDGYIKAGDKYALKWEQAEQLIEQMAKAFDAIIGTNHDNHEKVILKTKAIANQALTDYNNYKKGKDERD